MQEIKFFTVITVFKNAENYLKETIESVINQEFRNKKFKIQYIIVNGQSNDGSENIVNNFKDEDIEYYNRKDKGLFDSLSFALTKVKGQVTSYLNAGDYYSKNCLSTVQDVFNNNKEVNWLTGLKFIYNEKSQIIDIKTPYKYRSNLIQCGVYGKYLPFIQQESTFWKSSLNENINLDKLAEFRNCGDMYLWQNFSKKTQLYIVNSYLAGFKYHKNQITFDKTGKIDVYLNEAKKINKKINLKDYYDLVIDSVSWFLLNKLKNKLKNKNNGYIKYNSEKDLWE